MPDVYGNNLPLPSTPNVDSISTFTDTNPSQTDISIPQAQGSSKVDDFQSYASQIYADVNKQPWVKSELYNNPITKTPIADAARLLNSDYGFSPFDTDLEQKLADKQGIIPRIFNRLVKTGATAAVSFAGTIESTMNLLSGNESVTAPIEEAGNQWLRRLDNEVFPNFQTRYQKEHPLGSYFNPFKLTSFLDNVGNLTQNLGSTIGAIGAAALVDIPLAVMSEGIADALILPKQLERIFSGVGKFSRIVAEGGENYNAFLKTVNQSEEVLKGVTTALNNVNNFKQISNVGRFLTSVGLSAYGEAVVEGNNARLDVLNDLQAEFKDNTGNVATSDEMKQKIQDTATAAGKAVVGPNFAFLAVSNAIGLGSILRPAGAAIAATEKALAKEVSVSLNAKNINTFDVVSKTYSKGLKGLAQRLANPTSLIADNVREGVEEGYQYVVSDANKTYYERQFHKRGNEDAYSLIDAYSKSMGTLFTSTEGQENMLLGFLGGIFQHAGRNVINRVKGNSPLEGKALGDKIKGDLESNTVTGLFNVARNESVAASDIAFEMQRASNTGDVFAYKNLQHEGLFNFVNSGVKSHKFDARVEQLEALKNLDKDNFETFFNMELNGTNQKTVNDYMDNLINKAKVIKEDIDRVNGAFSDNPFSKRKEADKHIAYDFYKSELAFSLSKQRDYQRRSSSLREDIFSKVPSGSYEDVIALSDDKGIQNTVDTLTKKTLDLKNSETLAAGNEDLIKGYAEQRAFLEEIVSDLKGNLKNFNPDLYMQTVNSLYNYYGNGNQVKGEFKLDELSALNVFNNAYDAHNLLASTRSTVDYYKKLAGKTGLQDFIFDYTSKLNSYADRVNIDSNGNFSILSDEELAAKNSPVEQDAIEADQHLKEYVGVETKEEAIAKVDEEDKAVIAKLVDPNYETSEDPDSLGKQIEDGRQPITEEIKEKAKAVAEQHFETVAESKKERREKSLQEQKDRLGISEPDLSLTEPFDGAVTTEEKSEVVGEAKGEAKKRRTFFGLIDPQTLLNKIFSPNKTDVKYLDNLKSLIFSTTSKEEITKNIFNTLNVEITPSTKGKSKDDFTKHPIFKELYRRGYDTDIALYSGNKPLGFITPANSLYYKKGDGYIPISNLTRDEYVATTGNKPESYDLFMSDIKGYQQAIDKLLIGYDGVKKQIDNVVFQSIFRPVISYGSYDDTNKASKATLIKDLPYKGKNDVILSFPMIYDEATDTIERTSIPTVLDAKNISQERLDGINDYISRHLDDITKLDGRYIYLMQMPDGNFKYFRARPKSQTIENINSLATDLKDIISNGDNKSIKELNEKIRNEFYIASQQAGTRKTNLNLSVDKDGNLQLAIVNKKILSKVNVLTISKAEVGALENFDDLKNLLNTKISDAEAKNLNLKSLKIEITDDSFKNNILGDENVKTKQLEESLTLPITKNSFADFSMKLVPAGNQEAEIIQEQAVEAVPIEQEERVEVKPDLVDSNFKNVIEELKNKGLVKTTC